MSEMYRLIFPNRDKQELFGKQSTHPKLIDFLTRKITKHKI